MICANCKSDKCPAPASEPTATACGNGYGVVNIGDLPRPVVVNEWQERAQKAEAEVAFLTAGIEAAGGGAISARDWMGMWDTARKRADNAEADAKTLRGAIAAQDARDLAACERVGIPPQGCDTADELADEVLAARRRADEAEASLAQAGAAVAAQEDRDAAACGRIGLFPDGPNTADMLADEVIELRLQVSAMEAKANAALVDVAALKTALASIASQMGGTVTGCSVEMHCAVPAEVAAVLAKVRGALNPDIGLTNDSMQAGYRAAAVAVAKALGEVQS